MSKSTINDVEFPGTEIEISGQKYIMPPLGLNAYSDHDAFKKIQAVLKAILPLIDSGKTSEEDIFTFITTADIPSETFSHIAELILLAIQRNYPNFMTLEEFKSKLDLIEGFTKIALVINQSQPKRKNAPRQLENPEPMATQK